MADESTRALCESLIPAKSASPLAICEGTYSGRFVAEEYAQHRMICDMFFYQSMHVTGYRMTLTPKAPMASSLSASCTTASSLHPPSLCISATIPSHRPAARSFFSVDHEMRGMILKRRDFCRSVSMDVASVEVRKGARVDSRDDVSVYLAVQSGRRI